ncbi:MAG: hypothetical protein ACRDHL_05715 [Candidatus Promineifilaceae bacterium]
MDAILLGAKLLVVALFLVMFLRGNKLIWGIGLLTVTSAVLLDAFLGTFGRQEMLAQLGFVFYVLAGALFAGAAVWLWGLLRPQWQLGAPAAPGLKTEPAESALAEAPPTWSGPVAMDGAAVAYDRQLLYATIRERLGEDDLRDLLFDLGLNELDVALHSANGSQVVVEIMAQAERRELTGPMSLAVERILKPVPAGDLPTAEELAADSPPSVVRHYLLAHFNRAELKGLAGALAVDWENIAGNSKKAQARNLLLYLYRRNRVEELIGRLQAAAKKSA